MNTRELSRQSRFSARERLDRSNGSGAKSPDMLVRPDVDSAH